MRERAICSIIFLLSGQIRGVASKQLVQDLVLTSPATFLSFQQILCPLPTLDIHSNKERHRFDLRDNTDQTRWVSSSDDTATNPIRDKRHN